jgi:hypothetical protein
VKLMSEKSTAANRMRVSVPVQHFDQIHLAERWRMSPRTLEQWRWQGRGPRFLKLGGRVLYPVKEVEAFEGVNLHANTVAALPMTVHPDGADAQR